MEIEEISAPHPELLSADYREDLPSEIFLSIWQILIGGGLVAVPTNK
jgi:hypothetical protein